MTHLDRQDMHNGTPTPEDGGAPGMDDEGGGRRRFLDQISLGDFVQRLARALDFWSPAAAPEDHKLLRQIEDCCHEAYAKRGKIAGLTATAKVADAYGRLDEEDRTRFFQFLRDAFSVQPEALRGAIEDYQSHEAGEAQPAALVRLTRALQSPRQELFAQFNAIPSGIKFLVDLRAGLHRRLRQDPTLEPLEFELQHLLTSFFNLGFLHLTRIGWDSPAALLEKLMEYEAVHRIAHWQDLKHRLMADRACYAFIHPSMPNEPVIFIEIALTRGLADNIQDLLDPEAPDLTPDQADTAIFYGISNAQKGLRGIPFGNLLIKKVAAQLRGQAPNLKTFATLSPLPRFRADFLEPGLANGTLERFFDVEATGRVRSAAGRENLSAAVAALLALPEWWRKPVVSNALRPGLMQAALHYLSLESRDGRAVCPVAHFHGSNGALLARLNWLADTSSQGITNSAGIMVNYLYDMEGFERHQERYLQAGQIAVGRNPIPG